MTLPQEPSQGAGIRAQPSPARGALPSCGVLLKEREQETTGEASFCSWRPLLQAGELPVPCVRQAQACSRLGGQECGPCYSLTARNICAIVQCTHWMAGGKAARPRSTPSPSTLPADQGRDAEQTDSWESRQEGRKAGKMERGREGRLLCRASTTTCPIPTRKEGFESDRSTCRAVDYYLSTSRFSVCVPHFETRIRS